MTDHVTQISAHPPRQIARYTQTQPRAFLLGGQRLIETGEFPENAFAIFRTDSRSTIADHYLHGSVLRSIDTQRQLAPPGRILADIINEIEYDMVKHITIRPTQRGMIQLLLHNLHP